MKTVLHSFSYLPAAALKTFRDEAAGLLAARRQLVAYPLHLRSVERAHVLAGMVDVPKFRWDIRDAEIASFLELQEARPVLSPVHVRHGRDVGVLGASAAAGPVELVGADVDEAGDVAVVGVVERDDLPGAGVDARHAQGEVVGLGARVDEEDHAQLLGEGGDEALGVQDQVVVQEPVVRVEDGHLLLPFTSKSSISNIRYEFVNVV